MSRYVGAGNAKIVTRNQGGGDKKQGLAPCATHYFMADATGNEYYTESGDGRQRFTLACVNQLGGIGRKRSQFRPNADGKRGEGCETLLQLFNQIKDLLDPIIVQMVNEINTIIQNNNTKLLGNAENYKLQHNLITYAMIGNKEKFMTDIIESYTDIKNNKFVTQNSHELNNTENNNNILKQLQYYNNDANAEIFIDLDKSTLSLSYVDSIILGKNLHGQIPDLDLKFDKKTVRLPNNLNELIKRFNTLFANMYPKFIFNHQVQRDYGTHVLSLINNNIIVGNAYPLHILLYPIRLYGYLIIEELGIPILAGANPTQNQIQTVNTEINNEFANQPKIAKIINDTINKTVKDFQNTTNLLDEGKNAVYNINKDIQAGKKYAAQILKSLYKLYKEVVSTTSPIIKKIIQAWNTFTRGSVVNGVDNIPWNPGVNAFTHNMYNFNFIFYIDTIGQYEATISGENLNFSYDAPNTGMSDLFSNFLSEDNVEFTYWNNNNSANVNYLGWQTVLYNFVDNSYNVLDSSLCINSVYFLYTPNGNQVVVNNNSVDSSYSFNLVAQERTDFCFQFDGNWGQFFSQRFHIHDQVDQKADSYYTKWWKQNTQIYSKLNYNKNITFASALHPYNCTYNNNSQLIITQINPHNTEVSYNSMTTSYNYKGNKKDSDEPWCLNVPVPWFQTAPSPNIGYGEEILTLNPPPITNITFNNLFKYTLRGYDFYPWWVQNDLYDILNTATSDPDGFSNFDKHLDKLFYKIYYHVKYESISVPNLNELLIKYFRLPELLKYTNAGQIVTVSDYDYDNIANELVTLTNYHWPSDDEGGISSAALNVFDDDLWKQTANWEIMWETLLTDDSKLYNYFINVVFPPTLEGDVPTAYVPLPISSTYSQSPTANYWTNASQNQRNNLSSSYKSNYSPLINKNSINEWLAGISASWVSMDQNTANGARPASTFAMTQINNDLVPIDPLAASS